MSAGSKNDYFWRHDKPASSPSVLESPQELGKFLSQQSNQIQKLQDQVNQLLRKQQQVDVDLTMSSSSDISRSNQNRYLIHCKGLHDSPAIKSACDSICNWFFSVSNVSVLSPENGDSAVAGRTQTSKSPSSSLLEGPEELNRVLSEQSGQILQLQAKLDRLLKKCDLSSSSVSDKNSRCVTSVLTHFLTS